MNGLKRTKGGVGSEGYDARQKSLKQFFSRNNQAEQERGKEEERIDLTREESSDDDNEEDQREGMIKTNGEANKRGIRVTSPPSPSPKKARLT